MALLQFLICFFLFLVLPAGVGSLIYVGQQNLQKSICHLWVFGTMILWACFQVICILMLILDKTLTELSIFMSIVTLILFFLSLRIGRPVLKTCFLNFGEYVKKMSTLQWIVVMLIVFQIIMLVVFQHSDADDSEFVVLSTSAVQTDTLFKFNPYTGELWGKAFAKRMIAPFSLLIAYYSKLTMVHPAIMSHTIMPIVLIPLAYGVYYMIGHLFYGNDRRRIFVFLLFCCMLLMFGGYSTRSIGSMLLLRIWQGKAVLASIILPLVFYVLQVMYQKGINAANWLMGCIIIIGGTLTSAMADVLIPLLVAGYSLIYLLKTKDIKSAFVMGSMCAPCIMLDIAYWLM